MLSRLNYHTYAQSSKGYSNGPGADASGAFGLGLSCVLMAAPGSLDPSPAELLTPAPSASAAGPAPGACGCCAGVCGQRFLSSSMYSGCLLLFAPGAVRMMTMLEPAPRPRDAADDAAEDRLPPAGPDDAAVDD